MSLVRSIGSPQCLQMMMMSSGSIKPAAVPFIPFLSVAQLIVTHPIRTVEE